METACILLAFLIGLLIGYYEAQIQRQFNVLKDKLTEEKINPSVITTRPESTGRVEGGAVVSPKSPLEIEYQENLEIRKLNPGA